MKRCRACEITSELLGKRLLERIFLKNHRLTAEKVSELAKGLSIEIVGGLKSRGWTEHDIDLVGSARDIAIFSKRLKAHRIYNPIHIVGLPHHKHSHFLCLRNGLKLIVKN